MPQVDNIVTWHGLTSVGVSASYHLLSWSFVIFWSITIPSTQIWSNLSGYAIGFEVSVDFKALKCKVAGWCNSSAYAPSLSAAVWIDTWTAVGNCQDTSHSPTSSPTTSLPSKIPTASPSYAPNKAPSAVPTSLSSKMPTSSPSYAPSNAPSTAPTSLPSMAPSAVPTFSPSTAPRRPLRQATHHLPRPPLCQARRQVLRPQEQVYWVRDHPYII